MNRHLQFILDHNADYIWKNCRNWDFGDHLSLGRIKLPNTLPETPGELIATAYWAHGADLLAQMAEASGRAADAGRLRMLFENLRKAFNYAFVKPDGTVGSGSQTSYVLALKFGLLPDGTKQDSANRLASDVRSRGVSLTTGMLGTQYILDVLAETGFVDLAYSLLLRTDFPSWGYMIRQGATTVWEGWSGEFESEDKAKVHMAQNHPVLAAVNAFLFRHLAGIDTRTPGFEAMTIRPRPDPRIRSGGGDYESTAGRVSTNWKWHDDGRLVLDVTLPGNTTALIHLPANPGNPVEEGGRKISVNGDIRLVERTEQEVIVEAGSGNYRFVVYGTRAFPGAASPENTVEPDIRPVICRFERGE
jgi:alpha-L-rhamnosidase